MSGSHGRSRRSGDRWGAAPARRYPRSARVNEILREVLADELERMEDNDERLGLLTVTAVQCDSDLRHALVLFSSLGDEEERALAEVRVRLQAAVSSQVRLKRTPQLRFAADPAVAEGEKIEEILRRLPKAPGADESPAADGNENGDG
ncbi:MAG TPA: 30S ribosome-binding factor RbfA [Acidimicrobiales bacterium]|nr:30S ribosome-binding factor RbfA [Acidimicrobiales bacterium]